jgi:hypothetical protein
MGKYKGKSNEERADNNRRQQRERAPLPAAACAALERAASTLAARDAALPSQHRDRGPSCAYHLSACQLH